jgi:exocyst complex component 4
MIDDSTHNPETDTFQYIRLVIESLNKMNRLDLAVDTVEQRLPVELFKVVEKSNNEVAQRHPSILRAYASRKSSKSKTGIESDDIRSTLLNDLLWTLYARFEAIAEGHRAVHDVVAGIVRREGLRDSSSVTLTRGFKELWKLYQSEVCIKNAIRELYLLGFRCVLCYMTTSRPTAMRHIAVGKAKSPLAVPSRALHATRPSECSSFRT